MGLTDTQAEIAEAITSLSVGKEPPFTTIADIAEHVPYSKQTVLNNVDAVVKQRDDIGTGRVGQANVYYLRRNLMEDIWRDDTASLSDLRGTHGEAQFVELRESSGDFDLVAHWYDPFGNEIEAYRPESDEIGRAAEQYAEEAVRVRYFERPSITDEEEETND